MEHPFHPFSELFAQLGLDNSPQQIDQFIREHAPLADDIKLEDAPFWTQAQSGFLREALETDSDWAEVVDSLSVELRKKQLRDKTQ